MHFHAIGRTALAVALPLTNIACGVGEVIRPKEKTALEALGEGGVAVQACSARFAEPLIVDIRSSDRTDFEVAMKESVAVVRFDCKTLKLLKTCKYQGNYAFVGITRDEQLVTLEGKDEIGANLPISGVKIASEIKAGSSLNLALITVGKRSAAVQEVLKEDLQGDCEGATHVVRGAYVGAFAMGTGTVGEAKVVADVFGAGGRASSLSGRQASTKQGDIGACKTSTTDATKPPEQCSAMTRLELMPLASRRKTAEEAKKSEPLPAVPPTCANGLVWNGSVCVNPSRTASRVCNPDEAADCEGQCNAGDVQSCVFAWSYHSYGRRVTSEGIWVTTMPDHYVEAKVQEFSLKACDLGDAESCIRHGELRLQIEKRAKKSEADLASIGRTWFKRACDLGNSWGCHLLATHSNKGAQMIAWDRGCKLGAANQCGSLYFEYRWAKRATEALSALDRACTAGSGQVAAYCEYLGNHYAEGTLVGLGERPSDQLVPKDPTQATAAWERGCKQGSAKSCLHLGDQYRTGTTKDLARALGYYERGCGFRHDSPFALCYMVGDIYEKGGVAKDYGKAVAAFEQTRNDYLDAFARAARMLETGGPGLTADIRRAEDFWIAGCEGALDDKSIRLMCPKAEAIIDKRGGDEAGRFYQKRCENTLTLASCTKMRTHGATLSPVYQEALQKDCQEQKWGDRCKVWKAVGGNPTDAELKYPPQPKVDRSKAQTSGTGG